MTLTFTLLSAAGVCWQIYDGFGRDILYNFMDPDLYGLFVRQVWVSAGWVFLNLIIVAVVAVLLSHKIAGPVYRFSRAARSVSEGDLTQKVFFRRGDEFDDLRDDFNRMVEGVRAKVTQDRHVARAALARLAALAGQADTPAPLRQAFGEIVKELEAVGRGFRL
jgi:methyl-accepting chemotaxis protein